MISHSGLIYVTVVISDVEYLFMYLLAISITSLKKCLFKKSSVYLKIRLFIF